jgi:iron-sulfur cluster assembly protein
MIKLTEPAVEKVKSELVKRAKGVGIRLGVKTTGCSGLAYTLEFADNFQIGDHIFDCEGCKVLVDAKSITYLQGITLDYTKKGLNEGFDFINPLEKSRCGCGESFRV